MLPPAFTAATLWPTFRWYSSAAERETYRVVDLNGQRAMYWVVQFHEAINPALTKEARAVFDSIVFRSGK